MATSWQLGGPLWLAEEGLDFALLQAVLCKAPGDLGRQQSGWRACRPIPSSLWPKDEVSPRQSLRWMGRARGRRRRCVRNSGDWLVGPERANVRQDRQGGTQTPSQTERIQITKYNIYSLCKTEDTEISSHLDKTPYSVISKTALLPSFSKGAY